MKPGPQLALAAWQLVWDSPFPATLQDEAFRLVDVNPAYAEFVGLPREALVGRDPLDWQPAEDRPASLLAREEWKAMVAAGRPVPLFDRRMQRADGELRWFRGMRRTVRHDDGRELLLVVMQDTTAEYLARERADRSARELDDWFELSPVGMVLVDERGLIVRSNPAFEALAGAVPVTLPEAGAALQQLLGWQGDGPAPVLQPGAAPLERQVWLPLAGGGGRWLRAIVRCHRAADGAPRFMAIVEDRSAEAERDLAQVQLGAMLDTAGAGLATYSESSGWVRPPPATQPGALPGEAPRIPLQAISRDVVLPDSMPAYDALQQALKRGERAEVRYAIRHPEIGTRWLMTRVEPAELASGLRTTSVVTLDITEQQQARSRAEALLREMSQILESTPAGIGHLRNGALVRCNGRFEAMLGLSRGAAAGRSLHELFAHDERSRRIATETLQALAAGTHFETEFDWRDGPEAPVRWYGLSVRRVDGDGAAVEMIAVLSDITRLKLQQRELEVLVRDRELMFSLSEVGIAYVRDGRIQRGNEALAQLTGWPVARLGELPFAALWASPEDHARIAPQQESDLRLLGRWGGEVQLRGRDGRLLWVQASMRLVAEGDPSIGFIASFVDVDARHRAEHVVALQAERTRAILDSVLVGIVTAGRNGIEWMNRSARRMFGGDLAQFVGRPIGLVAGDEPDHPFHRTRYLDELAEGQAETFECRVQALDGRSFWVVGNVVATSREGTGRQLTYALLDIERRRQAEARMSEAQASLQRIIEAAPMAITLRDAQTLKILQVNAVAAAAMRRGAAELIGLTPEQAYEPAVAAQRRADMEAALAAREVTQREYREAEAGLEQVWDARYLPLATRAGQAPDQLLMVATDVTAQRAAQEARFEAAIAQREMLVKEVHHRIKNNLQGVAGLLQQIGQRRPEVAGVMSEVIGQVQAIAQVYGLQVGANGPLKLKGLVEAIAQSVQRTFGRTISCRVEGAAAGDWVLPEAESIPIALTLNELLTNAVKHSPGTDVCCRAEGEDSGMRITIENRARLPAGFDLASYRGGISGLGLVRALLPRRGAVLAIEQQGEQVQVRISLQPPSIQRVAAG